MRNGVKDETKKRTTNSSKKITTGKTFAFSFKI